MITRMEIHYRSKEPYGGPVPPAVFTTGPYCAGVNGMAMHFDFQETLETSFGMKDGHLTASAVQRYIDSDYMEKPITPEDADRLLKEARKEDFTEIFYECFADEGETDSVELEPVSIGFYDEESLEKPFINAEGDSFANLH